MIISRFFYSIFFLWFYSFAVEAQTTQVQFFAADGVIIAGFVDKGAFLNFSGPGINISRNDSKFHLGLFPSLKFKEDHSSPKNALVTPALGCGLTYIYKHLAFQIPFYYSGKTAKENGSWKVGVGIGFRFFKKK